MKESLSVEISNSMLVLGDKEKDISTAFLSLDDHQAQSLEEIWYRYHLRREHADPPRFPAHLSFGREDQATRFFLYDVSEALHLSGQEKETITSVFKTIDLELRSRLEDCSQDAIIHKLKYCYITPTAFTNGSLLPPRL